MTARGTISQTGNPVKRNRSDLAAAATAAHTTPDLALHCLAPLTQVDRKENRMFPRLAVALVVLVMPGLAQAQKTPDRLLPPGSQLYLHWDGFDKHQEAYGKTAVARMMKGDTGKFLHALVKTLSKQLKTVMAGHLDKELVQTLLDSCGGIIQTTGKNGFALGVELRKLDPVEAQAVLVLPGGGGGEKSLLSLMRTILKLSDYDAKEVDVLGRKVQHLEGGPVHLVWWAEDGDAVLAFGTDAPESLLRRVLKGKKKIADRAVYKQLHAFEEFPTWARGFVDLDSLGKVVSARGPEAARLIEDLGLGSLKSLTFHSGFDGPAELGVVQLNMDGPRKGLLRLLGKDKFTLADLPAMPADITAFSADNLEMSQLYPVVVDTVEAVVRLFAPAKVQEVKAVIQKADDALGIKIGEDLFGSLGNMVVQYSAWAEGPLGLGQITLIKVKDASKLEKSLVKAFAALRDQFGVTLTTHTYHGVKTHQIRLSGPSWVSMFFGSPTFAIYKDWLAFSSYPQPVQGFILRSKGELPAWKTSEKMQKLLGPFPKEMTGIKVSDPRPGVKFLLSVMPPALTVLNAVMEQFGGGHGTGIDVNLVPNAYEATRHLFPNITVITDEGGKLRSVSRSSLPFPF
jgi:hypothetical protein